MQNKRKKIFIWLVEIIVIVFIMGILLFTIHEKQPSWPSILTSKELIKTDVENAFFVARKIKTLKGKSDYTEKPDAIRYTITTNYDYVITEGEIKYKPHWSLKIPGLAYGVNYITIVFVYSDEKDNEEFQYIIYNCNERNAKDLPMMTLDSDSDGLIDYFELTNSNTNPYIFDTDKDGISDGEEDPDNDGLNNLKEQEYGSFVDVADSDGDNLFDNEEIFYGTNIMNADTDNDGYSDYHEIQMGTDPKNKKEPKSTDEITYLKKAEFYSGMLIDMSVNTKPDNVASLKIFEIPTTFEISSKNIEGMIGTGICLLMDGELSEAEIKIELNCEDYIEGEKYYLYYFNEKTFQPEYVKEQSQTGNVITAKLYHFSKYFVSSVSEEEANQGVYSEYGIDLFSNENTNALFESYEDYIARMYPGQAVFSINICSGNIDKAVAYIDGKTGHTWNSYYYPGNEKELEINNLDTNLSVEDTFGAFGFGGWVNQPDNVFFRAWDGSLKLPSGYRELYYDGKINENSEIIYQSPTLPYSEDTVPAPENMNYAFISMPFVIKEEELSNLSKFINSYKEKYDLNKNNCTIFAKDALNAAGINHKINIDFKPKGEIHLSNYFVGSAGSPGQASYSIQESYPEEHVYVIEEILEDGNSQLWFTSKMAQNCKFTTSEDDLSIKISDVNKIIDKRIEDEQQKAKEWCKEKFEDWINQWLMKSCNG